MGVDDLAARGLAHAHVALHAAIRQAGRRDGEVLLSPRVASDAEVRPLHAAEAEAMLVVVTCCAQTTAGAARGLIPREPPPLRAWPP